MKQVAEKSDDSTLQYVTFSLDEETYGINVMQVMEVLRMTEIAPVPGSPDYVLGIINLRGNVITVIDMRHRFGRPLAELTESSRVLIIESNDNVVGMLVDSVAEVVYLNSSDIESAPNVGSMESSKFIQGVVARDGILLIIIDLNKLLTDEEWEGLTAI